MRIKVLVYHFFEVGTPPPQVHVKPALDVQKHDNIHVCLQFLARNGVPVHGIPAEGGHSSSFLSISVVTFIGMKS